MWHLCWSNAVQILFYLSYAAILIAFARQKKTFNSSQLVRAINLSLAANINLFLFFGVCGQRINNVIAGVDMTLLFALVNIGLSVGLLLHTFRTGMFWARQSAPRVATD